MAVNPPLNPIMCLIEGNGDLSLRDRAGIGTAIGSGALRYAPAPGARVNYVKNPLVGNSVAGWAVGGTTFIPSTDWTKYGPYCGKITVTAVSGASGVFTETTGSNFIRLNAGQQYTLSIPVYNPQNVPKSVAYFWRAYDLAGNAAGNLTNKVYVTVPAQSEAILTATAVVPAGAEGCYIVVYADNGGAAPFQNGDVLYVGGVRINDGSTDLGHIPAPIWLDPRTGQLGTAYASPSVSRAVFWVEEATTNLVPNPWRAINNTGWSALNGSSARTTAYGYQGPGAGLLTASAANAEEYISITAAAASHTAQAIVRNRAASARQCQLTYNGSLIGSPLSVAAGALATLTAPFTGIGGAANLGVRWIDSATTEVFVTYYLGAEAKTYATSPCPAIDSAGAITLGYTWAGATHASTSSRATTGISAPHANRANPQAGAVVANVRREGAYSNFREIVKLGTFGVGEFANLYLDNVSQRITAYTKQGSNTARFAQAALPAPELDTFVKVTADWNTATVRVGRLTGTLASTARVDTGIGATFGATNMEIGIDGTLNNLNGSIGPVVIYDVPLSDARRSLVNAAIDSNGATDLWTLLEEWEAVGLPIEPALQFGQATAGVRAVALPMETSVLQDGRGTAGVKAAAQPMEGVERQGGRALALDGARLIPVPDTRSVIVIGEQ